MPWLLFQAPGLAVQIVNFKFLFEFEFEVREWKNEAEINSS